MVTDLQAEPTNATAFGDLAAENTGIESATGLIPTVATAAPEIVAVGGAFTLGWLIGQGINAVFLDVGPGDNSAPSGSGGDFCYSQSCGGRLEWYPQGASVYEGATVQQSPGAYLYWARNGSYNYWPVRWFEAPCSFTGFTPPPDSHLQTGIDSGVNCYNLGLHKAFVDYPYLTAADVLRSGMLHRYNAATDGTPGRTSSAPADPGTSTVEGRLQSSLDADGSDLERAWLDWSLDPDRRTDEDPSSIGPPGTGVRPDDSCEVTDFSTPPQYLRCASQGLRRTIRGPRFKRISQAITRRPTAIRLSISTGARSRESGAIATSSGDTAGVQQPRPKSPRRFKTRIRIPTRAFRAHTPTTTRLPPQTRRTVVVALGNDPNDGFAGPKHIITTYVGADD